MNSVSDKIIFFIKAVMVYVLIASGPLVMMYNQTNGLCQGFNKNSDECVKFTENLDILGKSLMVISFITLLFAF
jgi:hypothetical protein